MLSLSQSFQPGSADLQAALHGDPNGFPFKSELSLAPLLAFWAKKFGDDTSAKGTFVRMVREQVKQVPELMAPITDLGVIDRHRQLVELLMAGIFAPAFFEQEFSAVLVPFQLKSFYATPPFNHLLRGEDGTLRELGISFVAYAPLGRSWLSGRVQRLDDIPADDRRRDHPRFHESNFAKNLELVRRIEAIAKEKRCTPA